jgi:hypothetical protein
MTASPMNFSSVPPLWRWGLIVACITAHRER